MNKAIMAMTVALLLVVLSTAAPIKAPAAGPGFDREVWSTPPGMVDVRVDSDQYRLHGVSLTAWQTREPLTEVVFRYRLTKLTTEYRRFNVMVVGLGGDGGPLWAFSSAPGLKQTPANHTLEVTRKIRVRKATYKRTVRIWLRVVHD